MFLLLLCVNSLPDVQISSDGRSLSFAGDGTITQVIARSKGNYQSIQSVSVDGLLTLDTSAFELFTSMNTITISDLLVDIKSYCFKSCKSLLEFSFPEGMNSISDGLFSGCSALQTVRISSTITSINTYLLFQSCSSLSCIEVSLDNTILSTDESRQFLLSKNSSILYLASGVKNQVIPTSVEVIDNYCYYSLTLTSIDFSKSKLESVNTKAFSNIKINSLEFPSTLKRVESNAFYQSTIPMISLPSSLIYFDQSALNELNGLSNLQVDDSPALKKIDGIVCDTLETKIFFVDSDISEINISKSVAFIESSQVRSTNVINVNVADGSDTYFSYEGVLYNSDGTTLIACPGGKIEVTVYSKCKTVSNLAFLGCNIERVTLNEGLTSTGSQSFSSCKNLASINFPSTLQKIDGYSFSSTTSLNINITFGKSLSSVIGYAFSNSGIISVDFGECNLLTSLQHNVFRSSQLKYVTLPPNLVSISEYSFFSTKIESVQFPNSFKNLGVNCFQSCTELKSIDISNTLITDIPDSCFEGSGAVSIKLPPGLTSISARAFASCVSLTSIEFAEGTQLNSIAPSIISGCSSLKTFSIPSSIVTISDSAFAHSYGLIDFSEFEPTAIPKYTVEDGVLFSDNGKVLFAFPGGRTEVEIGGEVSEIHVLAFEGCANLKTLRFGEECVIKSLGENTFLDCAALREIILAGSIREISGTTFAGCENIENVSFTGESNLSCIPAGAFKGCSLLVSFEFHPGLLEVGDSAFEGTALPSITLYAGTVIGARAFANCKELSAVKIKSSLKSLASSAFNGCTKLTVFSFCGRGPHTSVTFEECPLTFVLVNSAYAGDLFGQKPVLRVLDGDCLMPTGFYTNSQQTSLYEILLFESFATNSERE